MLKSNLNNKNLTIFFKKFKSGAGFTLVELIVVTAVIGVLSAIGSAGFIDYSRTAKLNAAANDVVTILNVAKSNSLSQLKDHPACTSSEELNGYKVRIVNSTRYELVVRCGNTDRLLPAIATKTLPADITFTSPIASFLFPVLRTGVIITGPGTIVISGYGRTKNVRVDSAGNIR